MLQQAHGSRPNQQQEWPTRRRSMEYLPERNVHRFSQSPEAGALASGAQSREAGVAAPAMVTTMPSLTIRNAAAAMLATAKLATAMPATTAPGAIPAGVAWGQAVSSSRLMADPAAPMAGGARGGMEHGTAFRPAVMTMLTPPAYVGRYGQITPIAEGRRQAPAAHGSAQAQDFFRLRAQFDEQIQRRGGSVPMQVARYPYSEMAYKKSEGDITKKLLSQQMAKPRSLNDTLSVKAREEKREGSAGTALNREELTKLTDSVYSMLESRIKAERRRFGF